MANSYLDYRRKYTMNNHKAAMKNRLTYLLPYGISSKYTLNFIPPFCDDATCIYDPERPMAKLELACKAARENKLASIKRMEKLGLIQSANWKCGTSSYTKRPFYSLTKTGMATLTALPDDTLDLKQLSHINDTCAPLSRYRSYTNEGLALRGNLYELAKAQTANPYECDEFDRELLRAIRDGECTPFAEALPELEQFTGRVTKYGPNQLYAIWRNSHIDAMFRANGFLTFLDRRQYDCGFRLDGITSENGLETYISKYGMTAAAISHIALTRWYQKHPAENRYANSAYGIPPIPPEQWAQTPSYYLARELPGYDGVTQLEDDDAQKSDFMTSLFSFTGLFTGVKHNYVCYHTKPGAFNWNPYIEATTKDNLPFAMQKLNERTKVPVTSISVDHAIMFCTTHHQFLSIFKRTAERHSKGQRGNYSTSKPYITMNVVPVNDSGTFLLRCLALSSPYEVTSNIRNHLLNASERFRYSENRVYPVTYDHRNVFIGHTMDVHLINMAYEDYLDGQRFCISCFPEQAMWYRHLMPECELL